MTDPTLDNFILQSLKQRAEVFTEANRDLNQQMADSYKKLIEGVAASILSVFPEVKSIVLDEDDRFTGLELPDNWFGPAIGAWSPRDDLLRDRWHCPLRFEEPVEDLFAAEHVNRAQEAVEALHILIRIVSENLNVHQYVYGVSQSIVFDRAGSYQGPSEYQKF